MRDTCLEWWESRLEIKVVNVHSSLSAYPARYVPRHNVTLHHEEYVNVYKI